MTMTNLIFKHQIASSQEFHHGAYQFKIGGERMMSENIVHEGVLNQDFDNVDDHDVRLVSGFFYFNLIDNDHHD